MGYVLLDLTQPTLDEVVVDGVDSGSFLGLTFFRSGSGRERHTRRMRGEESIRGECRGRR